jgi:hypothetical protein
MWTEMARTVDPSAQEKESQQMAKYLYDNVSALYIYTPLTLYAVNKEVSLVPQKRRFLLLKETSVTDNHWSVRGKNN